MSAAALDETPRITVWAQGRVRVGVMLGQPPARRVDDDQTDNEKGDTGKDLDTTLLRLRGDLAGRREDQNEAERVQAIAEPVRLGLHEREYEGSGGDQRDGPCRGREDRDGDRSGHADRSADRLSPNPLSLTDQNVQGEEQDRFWHPVGLSPPQRHADRRSATHNHPEHERHHGRVSGADPPALDDSSGSEPAGQHDAVARRYRSDNPIGHRPLSRRHRVGEGRHQRDHQQRKHPSEPDPSSCDDPSGSKQTHPPPVIGGERS